MHWAGTEAFMVGKMGSTIIGKERIKMTLNHNQEMIVRVLKEGMASPKQLAEMLGRGYDEKKAMSMVLGLARKGLVDKMKAAIILAKSPMCKLLNYEFGSHHISK